MQPADATGYLATNRPEPVAPDALPAYSGEETPCPKCFNLGAYTRHRKSGEHGENDHRTFGPSRKGERLERQCSRCHYTWDEALATGPSPDASVTADELAELLTRAHEGWALDLSPELADVMATRLLELTVVMPRPGHPVWQPTADSEGPK